MKIPVLPPRGIFAVTGLVFDHELPSSVKETLLQVMALAWANPTHETPPLTYYQLARLTGKSPTTLHGHVAVLRNYRAALRLRRAEHGAVIFSLADWLYTARKNPEVLPDHKVQQDEQEEESIHPPAGDPLIPAEVPQSEAALEQVKAQAKLTPAVSQALINAGIFSFLFAEVVRAGRSDEDLMAMLAWCENDYPERPGGIFMARLRAGAQVPQRFYGTRCDLCGKVNGHSPTCKRGFESWFTGMGRSQP